MLSVSRGAKGGGWSAPNSGLVNPAQLPYQPEKLTSYEVGEKATFWNGAARLNSSLYYYDYKNYQGFFIVGLASYVKNVNAQDYGGEMEFAVVPMKGMNLQIGVSNINSQVYDVPEPGGQLVTTQLPQAPKWSLNAAAEYEWSLPSGSLSFDADSKWDKTQYLELINAPVDVQPSYVVTNARLTYKSQSGRWEVGLYGKNIFDHIYRQYNLDLSSFGWNLGVYAPPRLYGITATYHVGK
jgi:iron complex outermembrane recepter protein